MKFAMFDTKPYDIPGFDKYGKEAGYEFTYFENHLTMDTVKLAQGFDGVVIFVNDIVDQAIVDALFSYGIKIILLRCAGFNNVDSKAAYGKIHIYRVPAYSPESVAEHAMAMLLTSIRRIHKAYIRTRDFNFSLNGLVGFDLYGKTVGVVGTGRIGKCFIDICRGFKMNIIAYDKFPDPNYDVKYVSLEELFKESDIISLHCPLTDENTHMINKDSIDQMKKGVAIVNTSRGALINTEDLIEGIKEKKVGAACLDVYEEENNIFYHDFSNHIVNDDTLTRLISLPNVIVTAHQGFLTVEALDAIAKATVDNIKTFYAGEVSQNEICYHCPHVEDCKKKEKGTLFLMSEVENVREYYNQNSLNEWERLQGFHFEFEITKVMLNKYGKFGKVLDIGGGPGRYSLYLSSLGFDVTLVDLSENNVKFALSKAQEMGLSLKAYVADARDLSSLNLGEYDTILLMGPLYHLFEELDREKCVFQAKKHLKKDGILFASFIMIQGGFNFYLDTKPEALFDDQCYDSTLKAINENKSWCGLAFTDACFMDTHEIEPFFTKLGMKKISIFGQEGITGVRLSYLEKADEKVRDAYLKLSLCICERDDYYAYNCHLVYVGKIA